MPEGSRPGPSSKPSVGRRTAGFAPVWRLFWGASSEVDRAWPRCRLWIAVGGYRRREGQGMVVAWRIAHRPEPRAAVLVSIHWIEISAILGTSKRFQHHRIFEDPGIDGCCRTTKVEVCTMTNSGVLFRMVCSVSRWDYVQRPFRGCT